MAAIGRPKGARDRKNIYLSPENTAIILRSLVEYRSHIDEKSDESKKTFEELFTLFSSHAINQLGSSEYLNIVGK